MQNNTQTTTSIQSKVLLTYLQEKRWQKWNFPSHTLFLIVLTCPYICRIICNCSDQTFSTVIYTNQENVHIYQWERDRHPPQSFLDCQSLDVLCSISGCAGCGEDIKTGQALLALDKQWHLWCFTCTKCGCLLAGEYMGRSGESFLFMYSICFQVQERDKKQRYWILIIL